MLSPNEIPYSITVKPLPSSKPANLLVINLYIMVNYPSQSAPKII